MSLSFSQFGGEVDKYFFYDPIRLCYICKITGRVFTDETVCYRPEVLIEHIKNMADYFNSMNSYASGSTMYGSTMDYQQYDSRPLSSAELARQRAEERRLQREYEERMKREAEEKKVFWKNWTLVDLDEDKKTEILKIIETEYALWLNERRWEQMSSGLKWFLLFLGMAILFNFDKILDVIVKLFAK